MVHTDPDLVPDDLVAMRIEVPAVSRETHTDATLPARWREEIGNAHTQAFGAAWARERRSALLILPSVLLPARAASPELNVLISPLHPEAAGIRIVEQIPFTFDPRLLRA
jgi:RES domain-containing protein